MKKIKIAILKAPGTNCDEETEIAFKYLGTSPEIVWIQEMKKSKEMLHNFHALVIPGGFTYGDYVSAGKILAQEIKKFMLPEIEKFLKDGKFILGICNGFQVLVKVGLLPGFDQRLDIPLASLELNDSLKYEDRWVYLRIEKDCFWTKRLPKVIELPVAHAEGRFTADEKVLKKLNEQRHIILRYSKLDGKIDGYPFNPNGSMEAIAGITSWKEQIFGLMPHPERFFFEEHYPDKSKKKVTPYGRIIFENLVFEIKERFSII